MKWVDAQERGVGWFATCRTKRGENGRLGSILNGIRDGTWAKEIAALRRDPVKSSIYESKKRRLPCFMLSASTRNGTHKAIDIGEHSGLLQLDIDELDGGEA